MTNNSQILTISKVFNIYKESNIKDTVYSSISTQHPFLFEGLDVSAGIKEGIAEKDIKLMLMRTSNITAVYFRDKDDNIFELDVKIPFYKHNNQYVTSIHFFGECFVNGCSECLTFDSDFNLSVIQSLDDLMGAYINLSGIFKGYSGTCGVTSKGQRFRIESIRITSNIEITIG